MLITVVEFDDGSGAVHAAGCADLRKGRNIGGLTHQSTGNYATRRDVVMDLYGGHEGLEEDPGNWEAYAVSATLTFLPCCSALPAE